MCISEYCEQTIMLKEFLVNLPLNEVNLKLRGAPEIRYRTNYCRKKI